MASNMVDKLIKLAQNIKDVSLRNKVIEYLKNPSLSHKDFKKYPQWKIDEAKTPFTISNLGTTERDIVNHTVALAELAMKTAEVVENNYGTKVNKDYLLAGVLIHDVMKIFEWKKDGDNIVHTGILLDHSMLGVAELYKREFPEQVIHMVASHFGEGGSTPPRSIEALILHYLDSTLSIIETYAYGIKPIQSPTQYILLDEDTLNKLQGKE
jgi:7,8-dihydroneopterin 2',3'-cyclic phosphate phosphodiesterase